MIFFPALLDMVDNVLYVPSQLIDDKKVLSEWYELLVKEMEMDSKYKHKIKTMEERWVEPS